MNDDRPSFEVVVATASAAERRLTTAAAVRAIIGTPAGDDALLETFIDGASADCARYCGLARAGMSPVSFGRESVRATWRPRSRWHYLHRWNIALPWRAPIASLTVTEDGTELDADAFELLGAGILRRLSGGVPCAWSSGTIVVDYVVGWVLDVDDASAYNGNLPDPVPADLVARVTEQVQMAYLGRKRDQSVRSESLADVYSATFAVVGGDSIGTSGLLKSLESALEPFALLTVA